MKAVILAAALALGGCLETFPGRGTVTVDPTFGPEVSKRIDRVAGRLCRATNGALCPTLVRGKPGKYRIVKAELPRDNAVTHRRLTYVEIEIDFTRPHIVHTEAAIAHELVHAYGVGHLDRGLMRGESHGGPQARVGVPTGCFDQRTLEALCQAQECPAGFTPECLEP